MNSKQVIIFEPSAGGHQMIWVSRILERASREKSLAIKLFTTKEAFSHSSAAGINDLVGDRLQVHLMNANLEAYPAIRRLHPVLQKQVIFSQALSRFVKSSQNRVGHIFIPFFDAYFLWPALFKHILLGPTTLSGIVLRTRYHLPSFGIKTELRFHSRVERLAYESILRFQSTIKLFTIDPYFASFWKSNRLSFLRDPAGYEASDPEMTRNRLNIRSKRFLILVYGSIDKRKAIRQLLEAMSTDDLEGVCLLVAGAQSSEIRDLMNAENARTLEAMGRLKQIPRFITDQEEDELFTAADLIWCCYANADGSSGVLIKAGRAQRATIVAPTGILSRMVTDHHAGWIADPSSSSTITKVLCEARDNHSKRSMFAGNLHKLFELHTWENFAEPIVRHLVEASR